MQVRVLAGDDALGKIGSPLDELHAASGTPVTARRTWLQTWIRCYPHYDPWIVVVEDGDGLQAVAPLARRRRGALTEVVGIGDGPSDMLSLPARSPDAADALARALALALDSLPSPWRLRVRQLPADDPVAINAIHRLGSAMLVPGQGSPKTLLGDDRCLRSYVSRGHHKSVKRARNKQDRDFDEAVHDLLVDHAAISRALLGVQRVYRLRAKEQGRPVRVDEPHSGPFFRAILPELARRGELEMLTLRLDGRLAAYEICLLDKPAFRLWNGAFDPRYAGYGPGRVMYDRALRRALEDPQYTVFDWMKGEEDYKFQLATDVAEAQHLLAWSSAVTRAMTDWPRRTKTTLKPFVHRHEPLAKAWSNLKRVAY